MKVVLLLSALASRINGDVVLTPDDFESEGDVSLTFGSHSTVTDSKWLLGTEDNVAPEDWAIEAHLSGDMVFTERTDTVSVSVDGACIDTQCDFFWGFSDGHKFITFAHDLDGGLWVRSKKQNGMYIYPPCGGSMAEGDLVGLMASSSTTNRGFWEFRDDLGQGSRKNFELITEEHNEHTWPITIEVTNDLVAHQTTFRFVSATADVECVYNDNFDSNQDLVATMSPDVSTRDDLQVHSITVDKPDTGSEGTGCPMATTEIAGPNNDISGCGLGCSTQSSIVDCRNACEAQSGCASFSWTVANSQCALYNTATPTQVADGEQLMCAIEQAPTCNIGCQGWDAFASGDPHSRMWNGVYHHFQGRQDLDTNSPQQFYMMTPCDHNDRHHQPFSILAKMKTWDGRSVTGMDYLTLELYDEWDTYYVFLSTGIRKYVHAAKAVSSLYDANRKAGVAMDTFYAGETIVANGRFKITANNNEGQNAVDFWLEHIPTGCRQNIYMQWQGTWNYQGSARWQMHYVKLGLPECYKCTTCGWLGDFKHSCYDPKVIGCDGNSIDISTAKSWGPGSAGWDPTGWRWQKSFVDGENCPNRAAGHNEEMDAFCDEDVQTEVIAKCQAARDAQATCCRNIGGEFCDELQDDCDIDVCIMASDDYTQLDALIESEFTAEVEHECEHQGLFGPVPKMLYEFRGDLSETMSDGASAYDLQSAGDAHIADGALVCDGNGDYVYSANNIDFTFGGHSMEVLVEIDNVNSQGGGTIAIDGKYTSTGGYSHNKFDSIVYNEVSNNKKWILGSEYFRRTDTSGSATAESATGEMLHLVAVYDPDSNSAKLYRNGVEEMSYAPGDFLQATAAGEGWRVMFCQRHLNAGLNDFEGKIMFGAIYDYALSEQDVDQLFRAAVVDIDGSTVEAVGDELVPGQSLLKGQGLLSVDHRYIAALKTNGKFVIYDTQNADTVFEAEMSSGEEATFGDDGNFVIYDANGGKVWHSGSSHGNPKNLVMGTNGRLLAFGADGVFWNSNKHQTVAVSAGQGLGVFDHGWKLEIGGQYSPLETYILYFCAALVVLNVFCGVMYCYNKRSRQQYKVVSLGSSTEDISDVETDVEDAKFLE